MQAADANAPLRFRHFELTPAERVLRVRGEPVALGGRAFDLLLALAQRHERLVTKQELLDLVWTGLVVEEHNIATQIGTLRKLLGAQAIATVPGRGYRLTAPLADGLVAGTAIAAPMAVAPIGTVQTHLPRELTPMLGREDDLGTLLNMLQRHRLVTLVGAGGIGKSLLAQHLLQHCESFYAQGVCWVELASASDAAELPTRIAQALGVRTGSGDPLAGLCAAVSSMAVLVALDNAEHLQSDAASIASALLDAAPKLRIVVTSQAPLQLAAERIYRVGPLAVPQGPLPAALALTFGAVALFAERARAADAHFVLSDDSAPTVIELCRALDGLPLALELAAARAPLLGVAKLAASMDHRLKLLTRNRDGAAPARQQTLRAALEWSHGLLDTRERIVFRRLAVMADSASLAFVQQVVADDAGAMDTWAALDALGTLVDRSLVSVLRDDGPGLHEPRYRLLESPRLLALEQLQAAGEEQSLRRRHATALALSFDTAWDERWDGHIGALDWARRILAESNNARGAMAWARAAGEADTVVAIAATLFTALPRSAHPERLALAELCESLAPQVTSKRLQVRAWMVAVHPMFHRQQHRSLALATHAVAGAREINGLALDRWPLFQSLALWIQAAAVVSNPSHEGLREALAELAELEDPRWPAQRLTRGLEARRLARAALGGPGQPAEQLQLTRQVVAGLEAEGADTAPIMGTLVDAELGCGNVQAAVQLGERMLSQLAGSRDEWSRLMVRGNLSLAYLAQGDTARARSLQQAVWPVALKFNTHAIFSDDPALLAALENRPRTAARLSGYAQQAYAARGIVCHPNEAAARERCRAIARAALGAPIFERLMAEGRQLRDEQIEALAFASEDSP